MIHIQKPDDTTVDIAEDRVRRAVQLTIESQQHSEVEMSVVFVDDGQIQSMNSAYRGYDEPTDVLSFPVDETDPDSGVVYIGDVVISLDTAFRQAQKYGHALSDEVQLLVVHGTLHLLGFDHTSEEEQAVMWSVQAGILAQLGIDNINIPDDSP